MMLGAQFWARIETPLRMARSSEQFLKLDEINRDIFV
jgi:hypothetical protein